MSISRLACMKVTAPAVVVLATVVNAAAANGNCIPAQASGPDLSWAVRGDATHSVKTARAYFAEKAATAIHSLDRLSGASLPQTVQCQIPCDPADSAAPNRGDAPSAGPQSVRSTHQHSAP